MYYEFIVEQVLYYLWFVLALIIEQQKQVYNCEAKVVGVVHSEQTNRLQV